MKIIIYNITYFLHPLEIIKNLINVIKIIKIIFLKQITFYPKFVIDFENSFAKFIGTEHGLSFCNGTSALESILYAINLQKDDEIIVPSATFHASFSPILSFDAKPIFVDVDLKNGFISLDQIKTKINSKTKAIICVYLFGNAVDNSELFKFCKEKNIKLIEDCSHCHGAKVDDKNIGTNSDASFFSLQGSKAIAAGEGGIVCTNNYEIFIKASAYGHFNRHSNQFNKFEKIKDKTNFGYGKKLRANPLGIALASTDLLFINTYNRILLYNSSQIIRILKKYKFVNLLEADNNSQRGGFFTGLPFYLNCNLDSKKIKNIFKNNGVLLIDYPYPLHHKYLNQNSQNDYFKNTNYLSEKLLFITRKNLFLSPLFFKKKIEISLKDIQKKLNG
jgi:dTDP-4-amino-4,6-dideoxygalactose transaminase